MQRGFSTFLILMFALGPLSSLIDGSGEANLPACCRRHGAHHCVMAAITEQAQSDRRPEVSAPMTCSSFPGSAALLSSRSQALAIATRTGEALLQVDYVQVAAQISLLTKPAQTHAGRGPPASLD